MSFLATIFDTQHTASDVTPAGSIHEQLQERCAPLPVRNGVRSNFPRVAFKSDQQVGEPDPHHRRHPRVVLGRAQLAWRYELGAP